MIGEFINRIRPEPHARPEDRPADAPETAPETATGYAGTAPKDAGPIDAARVDRARADDSPEMRLSREDPAFARSSEPAEPAVEPAAVADTTAEAEAEAHADAEAREDTHPEADVGAYHLGTADWRYSRADTRRRLPREETDTLICSGKVEGTNVYDQAGKRMGRVETVMLNKTSGQVEYAVVRLPGGLVSGESYRPVAWSDLRYDTAAGGYQIDTDRQALKRDRSFEEGR